MIVVSALACWCADGDVLKNLMKPLEPEPVDLVALKAVEDDWKYAEKDGGSSISERREKRRQEALKYAAEQKRKEEAEKKRVNRSGIVIVEDMGANEPGALQERDADEQPLSESNREHDDEQQEENKRHEDR